MILIETGQRGVSAFDGKLIFASQLASMGLNVALDDRDVPEDVSRTLRFAAAPFLARLEGGDISHIFILGAENIEDEVLIRLRTMRSDANVTAFGAFSSHQNVLGTATKIEHALGNRPEIFDVEEFRGTPLVENAVTPLVGVPTETRKPSATISLFVYLPEDWLENELTLPLIGALNHRNDLDLSIITTGKGKSIIAQSGYSDLPTFGYSELLPTTFARLADIAVFLGTNIPGERMAIFATEAMSAGRLVIDCTENDAFLHAGSPALRGPKALGSIVPFLTDVALPNRLALGTEAQQHPWTQNRSLDRILDRFGLSTKASDGTLHKEPRAVFIPTNGSGLGHARRCSTIARELPAERTHFLAFQSCVPMIRSQGLSCDPLVSPTEAHETEAAHDILNYLRMRQSIGPSDRIVFDGGHIFDSIYQTILEKQLKAIWIRRGLWKPGHRQSANLDRERVFNLVISPDEAFEELCQDVSYGPKIRRVGPVVDMDPLATEDIARVRNNLATRFGSPFRKLIVSMLGGGVHSDRTGQVQSVCSQLADRADVLHLILVWPNARVSGGAFSWPNTRVVRTLKAARLIQASDLVVTAAGYNSFHEILYHRAPAIFIPQVSPILDDQEKRAAAAAERDVSDFVMPADLLNLERKIKAHLDGDRSEALARNLAKLTLPAVGAKAAAKLIEKEFEDE